LQHFTLLIFACCILKFVLGGPLRAPTIEIDPLINKILMKLVIMLLSAVFLANGISRDHKSVVYLQADTYCAYFSYEKNVYQMCIFENSGLTEMQVFKVKDGVADENTLEKKFIVSENANEDFCRELHILLEKIVNKEPKDEDTDEERKSNAASLRDKGRSSKRKTNPRCAELKYNWMSYKAMKEKQSKSKS